MRKLVATLCLPLAALLGSIGMSKRADFNKGHTAYKSGDYATALREWKPIAEEGFSGAQHLIGMMYAMGKGVPQDYKTAARWLRLAAEQGDVDAQKSLGQMYSKGMGVPQDYKSALKWYRLSAEQGDADAQISLVGTYAALENYLNAYIWADVAATNGQENGGKVRDLVATRMTSAQIAEAQDLARQCVKKNYKGC